MPKDKRIDTDIQSINSRMTALEQLLEVYEKTVLEQTDKLYAEIAERRRAEERIVRYASELEQVNSELKTFHEVAQAISRTLDLDGLLTEILNALVGTEIFPFEIRGAIFLIEEGKIRLASFVSLSETAVEPCREIRPGKCLCGQAVESQEIVVAPDTGKDGRYALCHPITEPHGRIIVPLEAVNKVVGLLSLYTQSGTEVSVQLFKLLSSLGSQIGIAINNAQLYQETMNFSLHDPLTSLANRRFLEIQLEKSFQAAKRYGKELSVIMLDIDHFKVYNDTHGHPEGDRLLARIATILLKEMRAADYVFRYGGEEFLVLVPDTGLKKACDAAERLRSAVEAEAGVTISLGTAAFHEGMPDKEQLVAKADAALYRAKQNGRNRVEVSGQDSPGEAAGG